MVTIYLVAILLEKAAGSQRTGTAKDEDLLPLRVTASVKLLLLRVCPHDTVVQFQYVHSLKLGNEATMLAVIAHVTFVTILGCKVVVSCTECLVYYVSNEVPNQCPRYNIRTESQLVQVRLRVTPPDASKAFSLPDYQ